MNRSSGQIIKGYELRESVGAGGFGEVYRAYQTVVSREVAIKVILPQYANQPEFIRRFEVEAQLVARLEHPYIVPLYDYWRDPEGAYLVMRWLPRNLRKALEQGPWSLEAAARLLEHVASALAFAHRDGIIHRDIKPDNILLDEDWNAYLADFGIAKDLYVRYEFLADDDALVGSPAYLSPEQITSGAVNERSDIYSLGFVLYEVLSGEQAFGKQTTPTEYLAKHLNTPLPLLRDQQAQIPAALDEVLQTATAKDPSHRYANVARFAAAFRAVLPSSQRAIGQPLAEPLTAREMEVLRLMVDGLSNEHIVERLFLSPGTVKWYVKQIYGKLDTHSRQQAVERARQLNLFSVRMPSHKVSGDVTPDQPTVFGIPPEYTPENPYKGLRAFQEADAADFFGRAALTERLLGRLSESGESQRFLVVLGPSGSGKSSLLRAGFMPELRRGALATSPRPFIADMLPGTHPLEELAAALLRVAVNPLPELLEQLQQDRRGLVRAAKRVLPSDPETELILMIDQFEELFTLVEEERSRLHFLDNLLSAIADSRSRVRVIITLRADFYDRPLLYPRLAELVRSHTEIILPLNARELEQAIVAPAERVGVKLEDGLVATIINEVNQQPGMLPLLQYALTELFERREGIMLTHAGYQASGGVLGALARRADELYNSLSSAEQAAVKQMFLRLITLGEGTEDTRRRTLQSELLSLGQDVSSMEEITQTFSQYRLLTLDRDPITRGPTVELAHEALIRQWERLREWLRESREDIRFQRQLAAMASDWGHSNEDTSYLARGSRLEQFEKWSTDTRLVLTQSEKDYLDASIAERQRELVTEQERKAREQRLERRSRNFLRGLVGVLALAAMIAMALTIVVANKATEAQLNATLASARELAAASVNNLTIDPERSLLLALQAVKLTYDQNGTWVQEAEEALHRAIGTAQARRILSAHTGTVNEVAFSPDGTRIATASLDGTSIVWDVAAGETLFTLHHTNSIEQLPSQGNPDDEVSHEIYAVAYSPDGIHLATGSRAGTVDIWDANIGKIQFVLHTIRENLGITGISFNADGSQVAIIAGNIYSSGETDWEVTVWEVATTEVMFTLDFLSSTPPIADFGVQWGDIAFSPDGQLLALATSENTEIWSVATQEKLLTLSGHTRAIEDIAFSHDGKQLATASADHTVKVWDISTPLDLGVPSTREIFTLQGYLSVAFSPDGSRLATASDEGATKIWDARSGDLLYSLTGHTGSVRTVMFSPDGTGLATGGTDKTVRLWEAGPGEELFTIDNILAFGLFNYSPDGTQIAVGDNSSNEVKVLDAATGNIVMELEFPSGGQVVYSPDGKYLAAAGGNAARIWDSATGRELFTLEAEGTDGIAYSPDGTWLAVGSADKKTIVWDTRTGQQLFTLDGAHTSGIHCVAVSPDGRYLATGGDDHQVVIWDLETKQPIRILPNQGDVITDLTYNYDGTKLAVASQTETASVWDTSSGELIMSLSGHPGAIFGVEYSENGQFLATTGGLITKVRDAETGQELLTLYGHSNGVTYAAFSPDEKQIATAGFDNSVRVYVLPMQNLLALAQSRVTRKWTLEECNRYLHVDLCPADI